MASRPWPSGRNTLRAAQISIGIAVPLMLGGCSMIPPRITEIFQRPVVTATAYDTLKSHTGELFANLKSPAPACTGSANAARFAAVKIDVATVVSSASHPDHHALKSWADHATASYGELQAKVPTDTCLPSYLVDGLQGSADADLKTLAKYLPKTGGGN